MPKGFLKLPRSYFDSPTWKNQKEFTEATAELDLIQRAMYSATSHLQHGICLNLQPGELVASIRDLASDWKWSRGRVERFLNNLKKMGHFGTRTETGITVRFLRKEHYPEFFCASDWDTYEAKNGATVEDTDEPDIYVKEHRSEKNGERKSMSPPGSNVRPAPGCNSTGSPRKPSGARSAEAAAQPQQWNRAKFPTLVDLRHGLQQLKENDQLHLNDQLDLFDLLREIMGDSYVDQWQNCWHERWRENADQVRQAFNGVIDDLLNRPAESGIRNPVGHLNSVWRRLEDANC